jgi:hypothetical protein
VADPLPMTPTSSFRAKEATILQSCTNKGVVIGMFTDSINNHTSADHRYGSWHGGLQRNMDAIYQIPTIQAMLNKQPTPVVPGYPAPDYVFRALSFENHVSRQRVDIANLKGMSPGGDVGTEAPQHGPGLQSTWQTQGDTRDMTRVSTAMETYVATLKAGDSYTVEIDGRIFARVAATAPGLKWRKHEVTGLPLGEHTMIVRFTKGMCLFWSIDSHIGSERSGVRVHDFGKSGASLNMWAKTGPSSDADQKWAEMMPLLADDQKSGIDIGIVSLGTNNMGDQEAVFEKMLDEFVDRFFEMNPNAILHIMFPMQPNALSKTGDDWQGKHRAARRVASRHAWVSVDSLWAGDTPGRIPRIENTETDKIKGLHPTTKVYLGDTLPYGFAKTSTAIIAQTAFVPGTVGGGGDDGGGTGGGETSDKTPPTIDLIDGVADRTVPEGGTTTVRADIADPSGIGVASVRSTVGDLVGSLVKTTGERYELKASWTLLRKILDDRDPTATVLRCFIVAYDVPQNRAASGAFNINVPLRANAAVAPTITNITITGASTAGADITIAADITHASGIVEAPIHLNGQPFDVLTKPATGTRWTGTFDRVLFPQTGTIAVGASSTAETNAFSAPVAFTLTGTVDTTGPTGEMTKPLNNTTLGDTVTLEARAVDSVSGVASLDFYVEETYVADGKYTSGGLFNAVVSNQAVRDALGKGVLAGKFRARKEDRAGNVTWTDWVYFTLTAPDVEEDDRLFLPWFDTETLRPAEAAVDTALAAAYGGGESVLGLLRDPATGKLYDPNR